MGVGLARRWCARVGLLALAGILALAGLVVPGVVTSPSARAQPEHVPTPSVMFVLDASGSMLEPEPSGGTRMDTAKGAMHGIIDVLPVNMQVGLTTYGTGTGSAPEERAAGCTDVTTPYPVGPVNRDALHAAVRGIQPRGYTPIGPALRHAAQRLPAGPRAVVLISDGIDTCAPPPSCDIAAELADDGIFVHSIGFQVDDPARNQLRCIAEATGGRYSDAHDAESLTAALAQAAQDAMRLYEAIGEEVEGGSSPENAPELDEGQYRAEPDTGAPDYFTVDIPTNHTVHIAVTHAPAPPGRTGNTGVHVALQDGAGTVCAQANREGDLTSGGPQVAAVSWSPTWQATGCSAEGPYTVEIRRTGDDISRDVEISVWLEQPVAGDTGPDAVTEPVPFTAPTTPPEPVWGGTSFLDAATLPGTGVYQDRAQFGEYRTYRVWLDWGQALSYQATVEGAPGSAAPPDGVVVSTELFNPVRAGDRFSWSQRATADTFPVETEPVSTPPVLYNNRTRTAQAAPASQAGWYYMVVSLPGSLTSETAATPTVNLAVSVAGEPVPPPAYSPDGAPSPQPVSFAPVLASGPTARAVSLGWPALAGIPVGAVLLGAVIFLITRAARNRA